MRHLILAAGLAGLTISGPGQALELEEDKVLVLACLEQMDVTTTWNQCLNLMFQPCVKEEVGSDGHVACLSEERASWGKAAERLHQEVNSSISANGNMQLADILGAWTEAIVQNCEAVAQSRVETGAESARLGCEISEVVGLTDELAACIEGRSTAEYCDLKEN